MIANLAYALLIAVLIHWNAIKVSHNGRGAVGAMQSVPARIEARPPNVSKRPSFFYPFRKYIGPQKFCIWAHTWPLSSYGASIENKRFYSVSLKQIYGLKNFAVYLPNLKRRWVLGCNTPKEIKKDFKSDENKVYTHLTSL